MASTSAITLAAPSGLPNMPRRRVGRGGRAVAAMVVRVDVEAARRHDLGEAAVARGMLGQAMIDLDDAARRPFACVT